MDDIIYSRQRTHNTTFYFIGWFMFTINYLQEPSL